ncbi:WS/DGAT/MGAT family O-acyltransferase [Thermomonospora catenispora]|uniref:WS/DGAT/MGAT family O-acyltransferase n=1 Tax=Thermomonospora catenispora TaxID=2493090 RepID=UPI0013757E13|nr:wax ester/triacylglycerol synthase family O-acyltransferase [Thermomonospora catenispora]
MERMNALDAGFWYAESDRAPLHIASIAILHGPPPGPEETAEIITAALPRVPRARQRVRTVPLHLDTPIWVDDPGFSLDRHLRRTAVPAPGGMRELQNLVGRIMSRRLDPDRPLWEMWVAEGLADDRWALIIKVHHCIVDGVGGSDLLTALFDSGPDLSPEPAPPPAAPGPSRWALALSGLGRAVGRPAGALARRLTRPPRAAQLRKAREFAEGLPHTVEHITRQAMPSLRGPAGPDRRWLTAEASLEEAKAIRRELGGTVNDVILAAVAHGFRELLAARGELEDRTRVRCLVPVSVRADDAPLGNRVSAVIAELPCGEPNPRLRLADLRTQMHELKHTHQAAGADALVRLAGTAPTLLAPAARAVMAVARSVFQTTVTNIPGPQDPLYVAGREVLALYPYVPVAAGAGITVAVFSYVGRLFFGVTGDFDTVPDLEVLASAVPEAFAELRSPSPHGAR